MQLMKKSAELARMESFGNLSGENKMIEKNVKQLKALAEKSRMRIVNVLLEKPQYVESIAKSLQLSSPNVSLHLKKLEAAGFVSSEKEQYYTIYRVNEELLEKKLIDFIKISKEEKMQQKERIDDYRAGVIKSFFKPERVILPRQRKKRRIVLEEIIDRYFETGVDYTEKQINHKCVDLGLDDFCFVRRSMIDERLMTRESGIYRVKAKEAK